TAETAVAQYNLIISEKELLQKTLAGSICVLTQALELVGSTTFSRTSRIPETVTHIAEQMQVPDRWQVEIAASLSQMCTALSEEVCEGSREEKPLPSSRPESQLADRDGTPATSRREAAAACLELLSEIPRLENVVSMIERHHQLADGATGPEDDDDPAWLGGRILYAAHVWDQLIVEGHSEEVALAKVKEMGAHSPAAFLEALSTLPSANTRMASRIENDGLQVGMSLAEDLRSTSDALLMASGHQLNPLSLARLRELVRRGQIQGPFQIRAAPERP
ncbi:MAG: HD domain-containing phosphohydrolase, partial [Myxococcota bacterium]